MKIPESDAVSRELQDLHDELIAQGCNQFFIDGIGGPMDSDVERLGFFDLNWEVYYSERGQKEQVIFSTSDISEAIAFYRKHTLSLEHWHLVAFTRSLEVFSRYKSDLEKAGISTVQNDIDNYGKADDRVYRLFVVNKAIFKARQLFTEIPFFDQEFERFRTF